MTNIILASTSPRRQQILHDVGLRFVTIASDYEEDNSLNLPPHELIKKHAIGKAEVVATSHPQAIVIGADTLFAFDGQVLGKPNGREGIIEYLSLLSGKIPEVITGVAVIQGTRTEAITVTTRVHFRELSKKEIEAYAHTNEGLDKAGGFAIQGKGALLVDKIDGDYLNVVGLPLSALNQLLKRFNISLL